MSGSVDMEVTYFPPLDKCLSGDCEVVPWTAAYSVLRDNPYNPSLQQFLNQPESIECLIAVFRPFKEPSSKSASDFETKTAPINITKSSESRWNVDELKEDAKWLSKELKIEELQALRLTLVERQAHAYKDLLGTSKGPESSVTSSNLSSSLSLSTVEPDAITDKPTRESRRAALISTFFDERLHVLKLSSYLVGCAAVSRGEGLGHEIGALPASNPLPVWVEQLSALIHKKCCVRDSALERERFYQECIQHAQTCIDTAEDNSAWPKPIVDAGLQELYIREQFASLVACLRLILASLYAFKGIPNAEFLQGWFSWVQRIEFLQQSRPSFIVLGLDGSLPQLLLSLISVDILRADLVIQSLVNSARSDTRPETGLYLGNGNCLATIIATLKDCERLKISVAAPAILAWTVITDTIQALYGSHEEGSTDFASSASRRSSMQGGSLSDKIVDHLSRGEPEPTNDATQYFAVLAVDTLNVLDVIASLSATIHSGLGSGEDAPIAFIATEALFSALRHSTGLVQYGSEMLEAFLSLVAPDNASEASKLHANVLAGKALADRDQLRPALLDQALARYPHELSPFLRLIAALALARKESGDSRCEHLVQLLDNLPSFTLMVPEDFGAYELRDQDLSGNEVELTNNLSLFVHRQEYLSWNSNSRARLMLTAGEPNEISMTTTIPAETRGVVVKEPRPFIFKLAHSHSALEFLGFLLYTFMPNSQQVPATSGGALDRSTAAEVVALFVSLLEGSLIDREQGVSDAQHILGRISNALGDQLDIINVIGDIFEAELMGYLDQNAQEGSLELVTACTEFFTLLVKISPERSWSNLARSSLLGLGEGAASLASVVGGAEIHCGRYRFLAACVHLHSNLVDDATSGLVKRRAQAPRIKLNRFDSGTGLPESISQRDLKSVLSAYQKILLDALQNLADWRFTNVSERTDILRLIMSSFTKLIKSAFGTAMGALASSSVLRNAADALRMSCIPEEGPSPIVDIASRLLPDGLLVLDSSLSARIHTDMIAQTTALLDFLTVMVRAAKDLAVRPAALLATSIAKQLPMLASLLAAEHAYRNNIYTLIYELVSGIAMVDHVPASILGFLKPQVAKAFLTVLTRLDRPLSDIHTERKIWDLFSAVMSSKQQWVSVFLVSGRLPRNRGKSGEQEKLKGRTVLTYALDQLANIASLQPERALGMLKFVDMAQQTLVWCTREVREHKAVGQAAAWANRLKDVFKETATTTDAQTLRANEYEMAAYVCDILAICIHVSLEDGNKNVLRGVIGKLTFLRDFGVAVDAYNISLHKRLAENFSRRFPNCSLPDFQRTSANPANYGPEYFYDRDFATEVLQHDSSWSGGKGDRAKGFADEFARANVNLSLVHAEIQLLRSWKTLTTTLCECTDEESTLQTTAAAVAKQCLLANTTARLEEPCMPEAIELRLELAFTIMSRLVAKQVDESYMKDLLPAAWDLVTASPVDYDIATAPEDVLYYRRLLQVLYLAIQPYAYTRVRPSSQSRIEFLPAAVSACLVSVTRKVIYPGFRALAGTLHSDEQLALPADFALLTAILQAIVSVPGINSVQTLLADHVVDTAVLRDALGLYSWSDQLAELTSMNDPIYGETATAFLLALSQIRPVAEQMALNGILIQLSSANLSSYFRKPNGKGPFDEPSRMFSIWAEGFLPLCLNLLSAVGAPIAAEVATFLNSFPEQLKRAERAFENEQPSPRNPNGGKLTLGSMQEAQILTMITMIVKSDIVRGAADGVNAADIPELQYDLSGVKSRIEALWRSRRTLKERIAPANAIEARWDRTPAQSAAYASLLEEKITKMMAGVLTCFGDEAGTSEESVTD